MKVGVVGCGMVGSAAANAIVGKGSASELVLVDARPERALAEAQDVAHGAPFTHPTRLRAGGYEMLTGCELVVMAAGAAQQPGETRLDLLARNAEVFAEVVPRIFAQAPDALLVVATNPVDVMTQWAAHLVPSAASRIFGTGTILDTARYRTLLGAHLGIASQSVHAYVLGEHGDSEVLAWSAASAAGLPLAEAAHQLGRPLDEATMARIDEGVRRAAYTIIEGKGATWYGIGAGIARIVQAVLRDEHAVLTLSTVDENEGRGPVARSLPRILGRKGITHTLHPRLGDADQRGLSHSSQVLEEAWQALKARMS